MNGVGGVLADDTALQRDDRDQQGKLADLAEADANLTRQPIRLSLSSQQPAKDHRFQHQHQTPETGCRERGIGKHGNRKSRSEREKEHHEEEVAQRLE